MLSDSGTEQVLNKHLLPKRIINEEIYSLPELTAKWRKEGLAITQLITSISTGFCYKRNNYSNDKGLKDNGYFPKKDQMTEIIYEEQKLTIIANMY